MERELVSIVMPAFNAAATISESVDSVLKQTYTDWELIIVDDCSCDSTVEIARRYREKEPRIVILNNSKNLGVSESRNLGAERAKGGWIAFLDSDDMWTPDKLERQMRLIHDRMSMGEEPALVFTGSVFLDSTGRQIAYRLAVPEHVSYRELLKQNVISCSSVLIRKELALRYPMKHDDMHEDYAVWLQVLRDGGRAYGINRPLLLYRMSETSKSGNKRKAAVMTYKVYRFMGLNPVQSFYYFCWYAYRNMRKYYAIAHSGTGHNVIIHTRKKSGQAGTLEVLLSCMDQPDASIVQRSGITTDVLVINQSDTDGYEKEDKNGMRIRMISTKERGLSRSRNMAMENAEGDICLFCDDDERFVPGYREKILRSFRKIPDADVIAFAISNQPCRLRQKPQQLHSLQLLKIKSWQIAFRREAVSASKVRFDEFMGAGSGNGAQEENKFLFDCRKAGLRIYYVPLEIAAVAQERSTWFSGYTEDFFYKRGVATRYMMGLPLSLLYAVYYVTVKYPIYRSDITMTKAAASTLKGIVKDDIWKQKKAEQ